MNIRIKNGDGIVKDVNNVSDSVKCIQSFLVGDRQVNLASDIGGDTEYCRTDEVEDGRVVFR